MNYKDYRKSTDGKDTLRDIYTIIRNNVLTHFNVIGNTLEKKDIEGFLVVDELDFVDKATVSICTKNKLVLLTNDKDFKNSGLDILTGNPNILTSSRVIGSIFGGKLDSAGCDVTMLASGLRYNR